MTSVHAGYDPIGTKCLGHSRKGTIALSHAIQERWGGTSDGIYNCRNQHGSNNLSAHGEGRAYDHVWTEPTTGFDIAEVLVEHNADLGIQVVIWWHKIWSYTKGWHDYTGPDPHTGHLHIEQNNSGADFLTYHDALNILAPVTPIPTPLPPEESMPRIYRSDDDQDPSEVFVDGGLVVEIASGSDRDIFVNSVKAEVVPPVSAAQYAAIKAQAH